MSSTLGKDGRLPRVGNSNEPRTTCVATHARPCSRLPEYYCRIDEDDRGQVHRLPQTPSSSSDEWFSSRALQRKIKRRTKVFNKAFRQGARKAQDTPTLRNSIFLPQLGKTHGARESCTYAAAQGVDEFAPRRSLLLDTSELPYAAIDKGRPGVQFTSSEMPSASLSPSPLASEDESEVTASQASPAPKAALLFKRDTTALDQVPRDSVSSSETLLPLQPSSCSSAHARRLPASPSPPEQAASQGIDEFAPRRSLLLDTSELPHDAIHKGRPGVELPSSQMPSASLSTSPLASENESEVTAPRASPAPKAALVFKEDTTALDLTLLPLQLSSCSSAHARRLPASPSPPAQATPQTATMPGPVQRVAGDYPSPPHARSEPEPNVEDLAVRIVQLSPAWKAAVLRVLENAEACPELDPSLRAMRGSVIWGPRRADAYA
eukprot:NODE_6453_length_1671_cov_5.227979.p1 GENE.NODE_6453_length_1671_cov_5.227979~~NODE_6453_length_1671_cov_5.227979.p1  ORF type:complete len:436 (-),score=70.75 NODE_6453_length_1671_cov_5.227979:263-1570(-)